jgi:membrane-bound lytic murein transglycosylase D
MTIMEKNAQEYGLVGTPMDPPLEYETIDTSSPVSLTLIADLADMPLSELLALNPAVLKNMAPEGYGVHVPKGTGEQLMATLQLIPPEHRASWRIHRVASGETLASIGKQYGIAASSVIAANRLDKPEAVEGDRLIIPAVLRPEAPARRPVTRSTTSARRRTPVRRAAAPASASPKGPAVLTRTASR